jgi:hypothetical protein
VVIVAKFKTSHYGLPFSRTPVNRRLCA